MRIRHFLIAAWMTVISGLAIAAEPSAPPPGCDPEGNQPCNRVPEPETLALLGVGAVALFIARRRNKK